MRRGWVISILILMLLTGAAVCFITPAGASLQRLNQMPADLILGLCFLLVASLVGLVASTGLAIDHRRFVHMLRAMVRQGQAGEIVADSGDLIPLAEGINDLICTVERGMEEARGGVKELEIQLKVATAERRHAQAILYSINDAVLVTDPFDELVLANEAAARTFEFDLNRAPRTPISTLIQDKKIVEMIRDMRQSDSMSGRRIIEHQMLQKVVGPDGAARIAKAQTFKVTLSCVADQADQPAGVVAVLHDMTREKEVAQMKNDFVSNVSHELRTPLASIKAYVEMLIDGEAEDEKTQREFHEVIQNEANRLSRLIDNILNVSRIESGLVKINKQPLSLTVVLKEAIEVITPQAAGKKITLIEQLTPVYYQTLADKDMLYQAVLNLLSNSVKYTPEGGTITICTLVDESTRKVSTRISDTGVGIPPKDLPYVFDKFYRVDANNHMAKGTGLGLPLVKHIVENVHGGRTFVESEVGKGSIFGFELELTA